MEYTVLNGRNWGSGNAFTDIDCLAQNAIDSSQRSFVPSGIVGTTVWPGTRRCSVVLTAGQDLSDQFSIAFAGFYTRRENDTAENLSASSPGASAATQSEATQYDTQLSVNGHLSDHWIGVMTLDASADDVRNPETLYYYGTPIQREGDRINNHLASIEWDTRAELPKIVTVIPHLALGAVYEQDTLQFDGNTVSPTTVVDPLILNLERRTRSIFAELNIPLWPIGAVGDEVGPGNILSLSLAGRTSWYSDVGVTTNPRISLHYTPTSRFSIEATWGTAYRAPSMLQQFSPSQVTLKPVPDPAVPGGSLLSLFEFGGNPKLRPEESRDSTLDFSYSPAALSPLVLNATAFYINDHKRIEYPTTDTGNPLSDANVLSYVSNPDAAQISQALAQSQFVNRAGGSYSPYDAALIINDLYENIARDRALGGDFEVRYTWKVAEGKLKATLNSSYLDLRQQATPGSPMLDLSGTVFNPPLWRSRIGIDWTDSSSHAALFLNYIGSSQNTDVAPSRPIASWMTVDATLSYQFPDEGWLANTRFALTAQNVLNRRPPFASVVQPGVPNPNFDSTNASAVGCFMMLGITKTLTH